MKSGLKGGRCFAPSAISILVATYAAMKSGLKGALSASRSVLRSVATYAAMKSGLKEK